ncbi:molybdenum ABC transporter ATP-binding protein ModC [Actinobacillus pleuropneumoniae]|uniref:Molybdate transporter ATP-binding protein n=4 Tax=Actinobacillus pleuropneumoniae TaxID=715 RepID=A0A448TX26_ACTPL|nr:molybdenum ABC transporter ATP-binding protein ModC [Actinobacillus pleuropneumoniae]ABY68867.1 molybdenum ABC transporter, ATP-binding protein [Actinobacillus pleuropneumoniae serovar 3 str. JL03]ACE60914.1 molybdenum import ATP-binding protein ModC [Actinobacillus pleuropneumoniae serovar 7 str. AP76]ASU16185.1 Maltose/maltodextrin import ATP-binding protein MalK [Actinobacillus pleuropneumoniae]AWG94672.1 molybdenum ABC transporter ATP-binding protein ModC [Actinobacillus pleuropneumoniae
MLQLNLHQTLGQLKLAVKLDIPNKGVTAIFGRSGAGKSSLINLIAGLSTPQKGYIRLNQQTLFDSEQRINLAPEKRKIGYVFQEHRLFPHYTVENNLKYGYKRSDSAHFLQIVQLLGIEHLLTRFPASLSGGEKQRVAIGRALLSEPQLLLMDEPLSALDLPRKQELMNYLSKLAAQIEIPILYVSHSLDEIIRLADNLILLEQGKVTLFDSVANVWHHPAFTAWQPDSQKVSLLELPISSYQSTYKMLSLALGSQKIWINETLHYHIGDKLRLIIASKDVSISLEEPNPSSIRNILTGKITEIIPHSDRMDIAVLVDSHIIWASISLWSFDELALKNGQNVYLQIKSVSL